MDTAEAVARRSECTRDRVGAVIVDGDNRVVATGYNGKPGGLVYENRGRGCRDWCRRSDGQAPKTDCMAIHAEANALLWADRRDLEGGTIYITRPPCWNCAKMIANSGLMMACWMETQEDSRLSATAQALLQSSRMLVRHARQKDLL